MGVPQFLAMVSESAGRKIDLRYYQVGVLCDKQQQRRPLRIGVDVSSWIYKACQGYGDMLGDARHLTNYGRATLQQQRQQQQHIHVEGTAQPVNPESNEQQVLTYIAACTRYVTDRLLNLQKAVQAELLVVLDGASPPVKQREVQQRSQKRKEAVQQRDEPIQETMDDEQALERRLKGFRRAGAGQYYVDVISNVIQSLRHFNIPFLVSPYESDGQLAFLANQGYIDLIVTEDSDLLAYGAKAVMYKLFNNNENAEPRGTLVRQADLGATRQLHLVDFSPTMLAVMFVVAGSDYCPKLEGIGMKKACNIVRQAFLSKASLTRPPLEIVLEWLYSEAWEKTFTSEFKTRYEQNFLSAILMFRHPVVYDPIKGICCTVGEEDAELLRYPAYAELCQNVEQRAKIVGKIIPSPLATFIAEGWIDPRSMRPRPKMELPDHVRLGLAQSRIGTAKSSSSLAAPEADDSQDEEMATQEETLVDKEQAQEQEVVQDSGTTEEARDEAKAMTVEGVKTEPLTQGSVNGKRPALDGQEEQPAAKRVAEEPDVIDLLHDNDDDDGMNLGTQADGLNGVVF